MLALAWFVRIWALLSGITNAMSTMTDFSFTQFDTVENLTEDARELAYEGAPEGTVLIARAQTAAHGRRGHLWHAPEGGLYLAQILRPQVAMGHMVALNSVIALAVLEVLQQAGLANAQLMWPNDVVVDGKKLASATVGAGYAESGMFAVAHVAVNLQFAPVAFEELASIISTHFDGTPEPLAPAQLADYVAADLLGEEAFLSLAEALATQIQTDVDAWTQALSASAGHMPAFAPIAQMLFDNMAMMGEPVAALRPDGTVEAQGDLRGLDIWGNAIIVDDKNNEIAVSPEHVTLRSRA